MVQVRRGGLTTFHGHGQLVCYPILNLRALRVRQYLVPTLRISLNQCFNTQCCKLVYYALCSTFQLGVKKYFHSLENAVIATLTHFGVTGYTTDQHGVWVRDIGGNESKICALGDKCLYMHNV